MYSSSIIYRGDTKGAPENTMPAFELAFARGAAGIKCDLQCTRDGVLIIMHDADIRRTTRGWAQDLPSYSVQDLDWSIIAELDAGSWFSEEFAGTRVPRLEDLLRTGTGSGGKICYINMRETASTERAFSRLGSQLKKHMSATGFDIHVGLWTSRDLSIANVMRIDRCAHLSFVSESLPTNTSDYRRLRVSSFSIKHDHLTKKWVARAMSEGFAVFARVPNMLREKVACKDDAVSLVITDGL